MRQLQAAAVEWRAAHTHLLAALSKGSLKASSNQWRKVCGCICTKRLLRDRSSG